MLKMNTQVLEDSMDEFLFKNQHKKNVTNYNSKYKGNKILMHLTTLK